MKNPTNCKVLNTPKETKGALLHLSCVSSRRKCIAESHFHHVSHHDVQAAVNLELRGATTAGRASMGLKATRVAPVHD